MHHLNKKYCCEYNKNMSTKGNKTFKYYYDNDDEFKTKHLKKLSERIECDCGFITARCNLSRHKRSHLHIKKIGNKDEIKKLQKEKDKIEKEITRLKNERERINKKIKKLN